MARVIGVVKLAPGIVGFYDELSKIHLMLSRPKANVYDYMNTSRLLTAVRQKTLILVSGTLNAPRMMSAKAAPAVATFSNIVEPNETTPIAPQVDVQVQMVEEPEAIETQAIEEEVSIEDVNSEEKVTKSKKTSRKKKVDTEEVEK